MKRILPVLLMLALALISVGCGSSDKKEMEKFIQEAFKIRAEVVFKGQDKKPLTKYFSTEALEQTRQYLDWSPRGQWHNIKDLKYSLRIRFEKIDVDGKQATATVYETAVVTWDFIDPSAVTGTEFVKEDAWSNRKHTLTMSLSPEGNWIIDQDIINQGKQ